MGNTSRNILATIVIVLLLGLIGGMIWFDRQSKEKVISETQTRIETTSNKTTTIETELEESEESQASSQQSNQDQSENIEESTEVSEQENGTLEIPSALLGLPEKDNQSEFQGEEGRVVLRSLGNLSVPQFVSAMADVQNPLYLDYTSKAEEGGDDYKGDPVNGYDFLPMFSQVGPYIGYADITIANLNMPVAYPQMPIANDQGYNVPKALLTSLHDLGTDIVTNANANALDLGAAGVYATLNNIEEAGLTAVGLYTSQETRNQPVIEEINGLSLAFVSYSPEVSLSFPENQDYLVSTTNLDVMVEEVSDLANQVDAVVVTLQLTNDEESLPTNGTGDIYQALSDAGAKLIIGNNPNKVQPTEWLNEGNTFAIYSQGSLLNGSTENAMSEAGILEVTFERGQDGVVVSNPRFMPVVAYGQSEQSFYQILPLADYQKFELEGGASLWEMIKEQMVVYTDEVEVVTHLETPLTNLSEDSFRE